MILPTIIETERLILRPFKDADREPYAQIGANEAAMRYYPAKMDKAKCNKNLAKFSAQLKRDGFGILAAELKQTGQFAGIIGLSKVDDTTQAAISGTANVEIGWALHPNFWGKGLAPEGAEACLTYAWETLGLEEIVAITAKINIPSQRVMEKIGMTRDLDGDFDNPNVPEGNELRPHVLYRISACHR